MSRQLTQRLTLLIAGVAVLGVTAAKAAPPPPQKIIAVIDGTQNFGTTQRAINFYDITDLTGPSVFNQQPLFSVWPGYEFSDQFNYEEVSTIAVNPANGTVYLASFDSDDGPNTVGNVEVATGDTVGDFDLYRIDYQEILNDFVTNSRPVGTMYAPTLTADGEVNPQHASHAGTTINIANAIEKIGEVARTQGVPIFIFGVDMEFVNPEQLVFLADEEGGTFDDVVANDHQIRLLERVSTAQGAATPPAFPDPANASFTIAGNLGGYNSVGNTESWEATSGTVLAMDFGGGRSEPEDMAFVRRDGIVGVWVGETDGGTGGDDLSFFELDFTANTATKKQLRITGFPSGFALDEDPVVNAATNDGEHDFTKVDGNGNLVIGESGFFDVPQVEPKLIRRIISNYNAGDAGSPGDPFPGVTPDGIDEITVGAWATSANLVPGVDDDANVTDGRFAAIDKGTGFVYFFDIDSGALPDVVADVYVFDPTTNTIIYEELNTVNHFIEEHGLRIFTRGDITGDGLVDEGDINALAAAIADPTLGGTVTAAVGAEWYDLTGDGVLDGVPTQTGDAAALVQGIMGTEFGDGNLNGEVEAGDYTLWANGFATTGFGDGDYNLDLLVDAADYTIWANNFGFNNTVGPESSAATVPEPSTLTLLGLGGVMLLILRRRRRGQAVC